MEGSSLILALIGSGVVGSVGVAVIQAFTNKRKLSAEATSIISEAAGGIVQRLENENLRINGENASLRERVHTLEQKDEARDRQDYAFKELLRRHLMWDGLVAKVLRDSGIEVPDAPPLEIQEG